ncbi:hypothetical protein D7252_05330 [Microbacterium sp. CGR2]|nr:hypothetical protein D7252_05330 [Microbacterium sp. CGR2]
MHRGSIVSVFPQKTDSLPQRQDGPCMRLAPSSSSVPNGLLEGVAGIFATARILVPQMGDKKAEEGVGCL